jgi:hypothetical protein
MSWIILVLKMLLLEAILMTFLQRQQLYIYIYACAQSVEQLWRNAANLLVPSLKNKL